MIKRIRLIGEGRGYDAAAEANEDLLPEQFRNEEEFLDSFYEAALEYEEGTRELEGFSLIEEDMDEDSESEIWDSYSVGVRLGIKQRWQEVMGMFTERLDDGLQRRDIGSVPAQVSRVATRTEPHEGDDSS